ncbi:MAG: rod shape-determining protein MreD [Ignavibacteriae bacterium]|jgi:rod shape-determining protein MreD|nr:MAG: rod shape-determining protein MreD [Ignavibacteriota bacterium]RPI68064.1 MAG: rod shape-determining protein MreD [Ignavibacteriota bacterium]
MSPILDREQITSNPALRMITYAVTAMLLSVVHVVFLRFIAVTSVTPDLLLILVVWIALIEGQFTGMLAGFLCGILFDVVSADVIGTNALAKTIAGFTAGYFFRDGFGAAIIGSYRFLLIVALAGFIHNLLYFFFYIQPMQVSFYSFFLTYGVATTLYTTVAAVFPMLFVNRKKDWN